MPDPQEVDRKPFVPLTEDGIDRSPEAMEQRRQKIASMLPAPPASQAPARRKRSDAGKARETFYVSIPGVRFDMGIVGGREAFIAWLESQVGNASDVLGAVKDVLKEIDHLRAK